MNYNETCYYCNMELSIQSDPGRTIFNWHLNGHKDEQSIDEKAKIIKEKLDELSDLCLDTSGELKEYGTYTIDDMSNAVLVFQEVFMNLAFRHWIEMGTTKEMREILAMEIGKNLHQTVLLTTGIDLKDVRNK